MKTFLKCIKVIAAFMGTVTIGSLLDFAIFRGEDAPGWFTSFISYTAVAVPFLVAVNTGKDRRSQKAAASDAGGHEPDKGAEREYTTIPAPENCERCGKELSEGGKIHGYCRDCWCAHLQELREFYRPYEERVLAVLEEKGIHAEPGTISGMDETGRPLEAVRKTESPMSCLGENDHVLWLLHARDAVFALAVFGCPEDALGLRYILPSADSVFMKQVESLKVDDEGRYVPGTRCFLAAVSDGTHVYVLSDNGKIYHTNPSIAGPIPVSTRLELHREIWQAFFSGEQLRESAKKLSDPQNGIVRMLGREYFDTAQKMFFEVSAYGSSHDGYDVSYPRLTKEEMIDRILRSEVLFRTWERCRHGEIPKAATVEFVEEAPEDMEYVPEPDFGLGTHYY